MPKKLSLRSNFLETNNEPQTSKPQASFNIVIKRTCKKRNFKITDFFNYDQNLKHLYPFSKDITLKKQFQSQVKKNLSKKNLIGHGLSHKNLILKIRKRAYESYSDSIETMCQEMSRLSLIDMNNIPASSQIFYDSNDSEGGLDTEMTFEKIKQRQRSLLEFFQILPRNSFC